MEKIWRSLKDRGNNQSNQELNRSQYSLVSCDLTPGSLEVWQGLPDEIKYDSSMDLFSKRNLEIAKNSQPNGTGVQTEDLVLEDKPNEVQFSSDTENDNDIERDTPIEKSDDRSHGASGVGVHENKKKQTKYKIKMTLLLGCWVFFTAIFLMYNEKNEVYRNTAIMPGEVKNYAIEMAQGDSIKMKLIGPFLSEHGERILKGNDRDTAPKVFVWLEPDESDNNTITESNKPWEVFLDDNLDYNEGEPRTFIFNPKWRAINATLRMSSDSLKLIPFTFSYSMNPLDITTGVIYAFFLLCGLYVLIVFEVIHRTMAAIILSTTSLAALALAGERPTIPEIISWLDIETLLLLFSMMILVAIMAETGIFDFLAVFTFEVTKGRLWPLIYLLCIITAVLSTFLDNVTTVLLMSPVTIRLCEVMCLDPVPILMFMAIYSNIGGTATPVGDPPNVIVVSNKDVMQSGINFTNFTAHMSLGIILVCVQTSLQIRYMFRDTNKLRLKEPREIEELGNQIAIWRRTADSLPHMSKDVHIVRERLERKIKKLTLQQQKMIRESKKRACPKETFQSTLKELKTKYKIRDRPLLIKSSVAIVFVVVVFFLHSIPELNRISLAWTALLGAILLLILADREDLEPILHRVEWSTLLFFAALFVLMEALSKLGLIQYIGDLMEILILKVDKNAQLAVAIMLILWVSGIISAFVDNIPLTTMMVRVVVSIGTNPNLGLPLSPLIWALLYGACLGGNGTLIGASANVVCASVAGQHGFPFTFVRFFKIGFPLTIGHLIVTSAYLLVCHCVFSWH